MAVILFAECAELWSFVFSEADTRHVLDRDGDHPVTAEGQTRLGHHPNDSKRGRGGGGRLVFAILPTLLRSYRMRNSSIFSMVPESATRQSVSSVTFQVSSEASPFAWGCYMCRLSHIYP